MRVLRGAVYMTKSSGPRTEPWGTPQEDVCQEDRSVTHLTRKGRDETSCETSLLRPQRPQQVLILKRLKVDHRRRGTRKQGKATVGSVISEWLIRCYRIV